MIPQMSGVGLRIQRNQCQLPGLRSPAPKEPEQPRTVIMRAMTRMNQIVRSTPRGIRNRPSTPISRRVQNPKWTAIISGSCSGRTSRLTFWKWLMIPKGASQITAGTNKALGPSPGMAKRYAPKGSSTQDFTNRRKLSGSCVSSLTLFAVDSVGGLEDTITRRDSRQTGGAAGGG